MKPWKSNDSVTIAMKRTDFTRIYVFVARNNCRFTRMMTTILSSGAVHFSRFYKDYPTVVYVSLSTLYMTLLFLRIRNLLLFQLTANFEKFIHFLPSPHQFIHIHINTYFCLFVATLQRFTGTVGIFLNDSCGWCA